VLKHLAPALPDDAPRRRGRLEEERPSAQEKTDESEEEKKRLRAESGLEKDCVLLCFDGAHRNEEKQAIGVFCGSFFSPYTCSSVVRAENSFQVEILAATKAADVDTL